MASPIDWASMKALSFDIYGTLIDWETGMYASAHATPLSPFLPESSTTFLLGIGPHETAVQTAHPTWLQSDVTAEALRRYCTQDLSLLSPSSSTGSTPKVTPELLSAACTQYGKAVGSYPSFADTVAAIQRLARRYKLFPLSNIDNASFAEALQTGLKGCKFDAVYTAEDIGSYKPELRNFEYLLDGVKREFGVEKAELVHVAQSLFHDHRACKKMGITSVWVDRKGVIGEQGGEAGEETGYVLRVESLAELADIVDQAFKGKE